MRSIKSMLPTLLCAAIILGIGYLGIVESGKQILKRESIPEKAEYENVGSNIFYGKIEDDIEIFPWNYYAKKGEELEKGVPEFLTDLLFADKPAYYSKSEGEIVDATSENEMAHAIDWYFGQLIAYEADVGVEDVVSWYEAKGHHIYYNMQVERNTPHGNIYFYQKVLQLGGKKYQVKLACGDWNIISFSCTEHDTKDRREQAEWKEGREKMVTALEQFEYELADYVAFMTELEYSSNLSCYMENGNFENAYLSSFRLLDYIMQGEGNQEELADNMEALRENWEPDKISEENGLDYDPHYSYQVVELKDMILLLAQGDSTIGIYYDPINQKFCGYNYFYEY